MRQRKVFGILLFITLTSGILGYSIYNQFIRNPIDELPYIMDAQDFTLPSIEGDNYTLSEDDGKVRILTFMYTKCPGDTGCSLLTANMANLQDIVEDKGWNRDVEFISIDFDYINDTMEDLQHYAEERDLSTSNWEFLLGNENQTLEVTQAYAFPFYEVSEIGNDGTNDSLHLSHSPEGEDPYAHAFMVYFIDIERNVRKIFTTNDWDTRTAVNIIDFLLSNNWENAPE